MLDFPRNIFSDNGLNALVFGSQTSLTLLTHFFIAQADGTGRFQFIWKWVQKTQGELPFWQKPLTVYTRDAKVSTLTWNQNHFIGFGSVPVFKFLFFSRFWFEFRFYNFQKKNVLMFINTGISKVLKKNSIQKYRNKIQV